MESRGACQGCVQRNRSRPTVCSQCGKGYQLYPDRGSEGGIRMDFTLDWLRGSLCREDLAAPAYSYVLTSVHVQRHDGSLRQYGSAPNFQGGRITLCTCKHRMRTYHDASAWKRYWIAGFSGKNETTRGNALFYLMKVGEASDSHFRLWQILSPEERDAKAASRSRLGDVFEPRVEDVASGIFDEFDPNAYKRPVGGHVHEHCWEGDVMKYRGTGPAILLVGDPERSFLWSRPRVFYDARYFGEERHPRDSHKWPTLGTLLGGLTC